MSVGRRYYIVVSRCLGTISWVVVAVVTLVGTSAWGQQPKKRTEPQPLPLLPATPAWELLLTSPPAAGGALDAARLYIPLEAKTMVALDRETGETLWTAEVETAWPPAISGDLLLVAAGAEIVALDALTGAHRWRSAIPQAAIGSMIAWGTQLFVPLGGGAIAAFNVIDGTTAWTSRLDGVAGGLHLAADTRAVYVSSSDGHVAALSLADGGTVWHRTLEGTLTPPALARDRVIVGSSNNRFYALDPRTGDQEWRWDEPADPVGAAADLDVVFLTGLENTIRAVDRGNGNQKWRAVVGTRPTDPPRAFARIVVVIGDSPTLSVFVAKTGVAAGVYTAPAKLIGAPLIDPTLRAFSPAVFAIMREGSVVALTPTAMQMLEALPVPLIPLPGRQLTREPPPAAAPPR